MAGIVFFGLVLRLPGLDHPFVDFHSWRQCDTLAVARYFAEIEMNILRPQLPYYGPPPNYAELEFCLVPYLTAWLFRLGGELNWIARLVIVAFSLWSVVSIYRVARELWDLKAGLAAAFGLAVHPVYLYFSRSFQPDVPMLALGLAALADFLVWRRSGSRMAALTGCFLFTLAVLVKPPAVVFAFPLFTWWLTARRPKKAIGAAYLVIPVAASLAYFSAIHGIAEHQFASGLISGFLHRLWTEGLPPEWWSDLGVGLFFYAVTPFFLVPLVFGLARSLASSARLAFVLWGAGLLVFFTISGSAVLNNLQYYYLLAVPLVVLAAAAAFADHPEGRAGFSRTGLTVVMLLVTGLGAFFVTGTYQHWVPAGWLANEPWRYESWYALEEKPLQVGRAIARETPVDALVVVVEPTPRTLFHSRRFGWFIAPEGFSDAYLAGVREEGARYLAWMENRPPPLAEAAIWYPEGFWLVDLAEK